MSAAAKEMPENNHGKHAGPPDHPRRRYGRRRGRPLRRGRAALLDSLLPAIDIHLPEQGPLDPHTLFDTGLREIWLEIGFGAGEHLADIAAANPHVGVIGCEVFIDGVASALRHVADKELSNIRIWRNDATLLLERLPDLSLDRILLLHPDPWLKRRHARRRFIQPATLDLLARRLRPGGELRISTDDPGYLEWTLRHLGQHTAFGWLATAAADWRVRPADWPQTRYESKALKAGRRCTYLRYRRR